MKKRTIKRKITKNKISKKRKYKKTVKNKTKKQFGGDFNKEQQKELSNMFREKGLNEEQINEVMKNLNLIASHYNDSLLYGNLKIEIRYFIVNETLPNGINSIVRWSQNRANNFMDSVETDSEDYI